MGELKKHVEAGKPLKLGGDKVTTSTKQVKKAVQVAVDEYIELDAQMKNINARLKELRKEIEPYMHEKGISIIPGTLRGSISIEARNMAITSSQYTSYDVDGVVSLLDSKAKKQCIVKVVDKNILELLVEAGMAPKEVEQYKLMRDTQIFKISHK